MNSLARCPFSTRPPQVSFYLANRAVLLSLPCGAPSWWHQQRGNCFFLHCKASLFPIYSWPARSGLQPQPGRTCTSRHPSSSRLRPRFHPYAFLPFYRALRRHCVAAHLDIKARTNSAESRFYHTKRAICGVPRRAPAFPCPPTSRYLRTSSLNHTSFSFLADH